MDDLTTRLLAAIDAKEATARAATPGPWRWGDWTTTFGTVETERRDLEHSPTREAFPALVIREAKAERVLPSLVDALDPDDANAEFITDNDPANVLRRCAADRITVDDCLHVLRAIEKTLGSPPQERDEWGGIYLARELATRTLAQLTEGYGITEETDRG